VKIKEHLFTRSSEALGEGVLLDFLQYRKAFDSLYFQLDIMKVSGIEKVTFVVKAPFDRYLPLTGPSCWLYSTNSLHRQINYKFMDL
jgi:hypothetical protein